MKEMQKRLTKTFKEGNRVTSVFKETLANAEEHFIELTDLQLELLNKQEDLDEMLEKVKQEREQTSQVISEIRRILGQ